MTPLVEEGGFGKTNRCGVERAAHEDSAEPLTCEAGTHRWREGCEVSVDRGKDSGMSSEVEEVVGGDVIYWEHKQRPQVASWWRSLLPP